MLGSTRGADVDESHEERAPRIVPVEPGHDERVDAHLAGTMPPGVPPIGLFRTFARNLPMAAAMSAWGRYELGRELSVGRREREIVIDRTCARCGCEYEWGVHVAFFGERAGLTPAQVRSTVHGHAGDGSWPDARDRVLVELVDALHDTSDVDDELWSRLRQHFDDAQLLDLLLLCGWYHAISYAARASRVALEPGAPTFASVA